MKIIKVKSYEEGSKKAFEIVKEVLTSKKEVVLGLATGSSPIGLYKEMIQDHKENGQSYQDVTTVNLDEYMGLPREHQESYYTFMHRNLFDHIDIKEENIHLPSSIGDMDENVKKYEEVLAKYKPDVQILGVGANGHIGFNEPGTSFDSRTHTVTLAQKTREDNARFFNDISEVPTHAITMGVQNILEAKKIVLVAFGDNKKDAVYGLVNGEITEDLPASILQKHDDVTIIVDEEAASRLWLNILF